VFLSYYEKSFHCTLCPDILPQIAGVLLHQKSRAGFHQPCSASFILMFFVRSEYFAEEFQNIQEAFRWSD